MLHDPTRHEALLPIAWSAGRARQAIAHIVADTERRFSAERYWPLHPRDVEEGDDAAQPIANLYYGACGVLWALHYLQSVGAARLARDPLAELDTLLLRNRSWPGSWGAAEPASYLMGDLPILLMAQGRQPSEARAQQLAALIAGHPEHPARELMWGSPGSLLAALFLHQRSGQARWAELFRTTAAQLWSQLAWSAEHGCHHWVQDLYGRQSTYLDAVHGFVATAVPLIHGRHLLGAEAWAAWQECIVNTVTRTAHWEDGLANWRCQLDEPPGRPPKVLMQFCHGAPGFVICLADLPRGHDKFDALLLAAGEAIWAAGPLAKGANLCHGTGGNGYAFLKLLQRSGDPLWLARARAFAMHGIAQVEADAARYGQLRYSLWTGDPGFAIYLWDCLRGEAAFPTLDVFYGEAAGA
ncbi:MAG TPA: LanC-like protein [Ideonella sp.]|nr:LanC-like protein [Ideonella sp.]